MFASASINLIAFVATVTGLTDGFESALMTPHDQFSSSIGVLGCKLKNTNRIAYWPGDITCSDLCVEVSNEGRAVYLLKIDRSQGAHDISYDAWNYLVFGKSAKELPMQGRGVNMQYRSVHMDYCKDLLVDGKLALSAANSMNYVGLCIDDKNSWAANNYELVNIADSACHYGWDEKCTLDLTVSNQPQCLHTLGGLDHQPAGLVVTNIQYGTGIEINA